MIIILVAKKILLILLNYISMYDTFYIHHQFLIDTDYFNTSNSSLYINNLEYTTHLFLKMIYQRNIEKFKNDLLQS